MVEWIFGGYYHTSELITKGKWYQRLNKHFVKTDWHDFYFVIFSFAAKLCKAL